MLYVYYGNDEIAVRHAALDAVTEAVAKNQAEIRRFESVGYERGSLSHCLGGTSLFGERQVVVLDTPRDNPDFLADCTGALTAMAESPDVYIIIEGAFLAADKKTFVTPATDSFVFTKSAAARFDTFQLADALTRKDKKSLWLLWLAAVRQGVSAEEVIGILWWQLKTLRLAAMTKTAAEAGMKDFPYNKAKRALVQFKPGELETLSKTLLAVYHEGHGGEKDIALGLEEWLLKV